MEEKDIFDLSVAKEEGKFVEKSLLLESEVVSDILDELKEFPWLRYRETFAEDNGTTLRFAQGYFSVVAFI